MTISAHGAGEAVLRADITLGSFLEMTSEAILLANEEQQIIVFSSGAEEMFGWTAAEVIGRPLATLIPQPVGAVHHRYVSRFIEQASAPQRMSERRPMRGLRKNGEEFDADISISNLNILDAPAVMAVVRDVSHMRRLDDAIRRAEQVEAMGRLAGGVAHDFNNLLTVIRISSSFVAGDPSLSDAARADLTTISDAADRASELTRELLALGRRQVLKPAPLDLCALVRGKLSLVQRLAGANIKVSLELPSSPVTVEADAAQIERSLVNLVTNASQAMPSGGLLTIAVRAAEVPTLAAAGMTPPVSGQRFASLCVADTGEGMSAETMARLFEPFFTTKGGRGTGLGLASVRGIAEQSGGMVDVRSEVGGGTAITVWLPVAESNGAAVVPAATAQSGPTATVAHGRLVLVVDDDADVRSSIARVLQSEGFSVLEAHDATSALRVAEQRRGDLAIVVSDVVMPGQNGLELVNELRRRIPNLAVLLLSGHSNRVITELGALPPHSGFLDKPFTLKQLMEAVGRALELRPTAHRDV